MKNKKIPSKKDYETFVNEFSDKIKEESPATCFYIFGSMSNGTCNYGRSDIDGGLILNSEIKTPKKEILRIAKSFAEIAKKTNVETQFNLLDRQTNLDGRFLSYTEDYTDWIKESGKIICGPDYISEMKGLNYKSGVLYNAGYNFSGPRGIRNALLYSIKMFEKDSENFQERVIESLDKLVKFPKKLLWLRGQEIIPCRQESQRKLAEILEDVDWSFFDKVNHLFDNSPQKFYELISNYNITLELLRNSLDAAEELIKLYIKHFPDVSEKEVKQTQKFKN